MFHTLKLVTIGDMHFSVQEFALLAIGNDVNTNKLIF